MKKTNIVAAFVIFALAICSRANAQTITVFAHFVNWHQKTATDDSWNKATTMPLRMDSQGYDSCDPQIIHAQNQEMHERGIVPLISWWGKSSNAGDYFLDECYLPIKSPVKFGLLYEVTNLLWEEGHGTADPVYDFNDPRNADKFVADMEYLNERYLSNPALNDRIFRIDDRPVVFIWLTHAFRGPFYKAAQKVKERTGIYLIGSDFNVFAYFREGLKDIVGGLDAVSAYGLYSPAAVRQYGEHQNQVFADNYFDSLVAWSKWLAENSPSTKLITPISFAYEDKRKNPAITSTPEEADYLANTARSFIDLRQFFNPDQILPAVLIVSYNEHFEGTSIEPTIRYGYDFLDIVEYHFRKRK